MPKFDELTGKQFIEDYDGVELFKIYTPKIAKLPKLAYKAQYSKNTMEVVALCVKLGRCTQDEADALIKAFNEKYDK